MNAGDISTMIDKVEELNANRADQNYPEDDELGYESNDWCDGFDEAIELMRAKLEKIS